MNSHPDHNEHKASLTNETAAPLPGSAMNPQFLSKIEELQLQGLTAENNLRGIVSYTLGSLIAEIEYLHLDIQELRAVSPNAAHRLTKLTPAVELMSKLTKSTSTFAGLLEIREANPKPSSRRPRRLLGGPKAARQKSRKPKKAK